MVSRVRIAFGVVLLLALITSITAFAKGNFAFISITGPELKGAVRTTNAALTGDFFAFADLTQPLNEAPANPGSGYLVTRYYVDGDQETVFDRLHYYPDADLVYYDGIANGRSGYDERWYTASPKIKTAFEDALTSPQPVAPVAQSEPTPFLDRSRSITLAVAAAGLIIALVFISRFRKPVTH